MSSYSIRDLERLSGVKAHTLRIWEKRYSFLEPDRTQTNIRRYSDDELKLLMNVSFLNRQGVKISRIAELTKKQITEQVKNIISTNYNEEDQVEQLVLTILTFDEQLFEDLLNRNILQIGFENTMERIVFRFLQRIGWMWQYDSIFPAQEHFISNIVRQKLISAIDKQKIPVTAQKKCIVFLPEHEQHELSLLYCNYLLRKNNIATIYLGQQVPMDNLEKVCHYIKPQYLLTVLTIPLPGNVLAFIKKIVGTYPSAGLLLGGKQTTEIPPAKLPRNVLSIHAFSDIPRLVK